MVIDNKQKKISDKSRKFKLKKKRVVGIGRGIWSDRREVALPAALAAR